VWWALNDTGLCASGQQSFNDHAEPRALGSTAPHAKGSKVRGGQDPPSGAHGVRAIAVLCPACVLMGGETVGMEATTAANVTHVLLTRVPGIWGFLFSPQRSRYGRQNLA